MNSSPLPYIFAAFERLLPVLLLAGSAATAVAIAGHVPGGMPYYWEPGVPADLGYFVGAAVAVALTLRCLARERAHEFLLAALALYLAAGLGLPAVAGTLLFFGACWCYGQLLLAALFPQAGNSFGWTRPLLLGLALLASLDGLLVHLPVNYRALHLLLQLAPCCMLLKSAGMSAAARELLLAGMRARHELRQLPFWYFALAAVLCGALARLAFLPTLSSDDLALHLRLWAELSWFHEGTFDVRDQIWAAAPFAVDLLHAVISLVAGTDARGAFNLALALVLMRQLWMILAHLGLAPGGRLLALLLFVSTPLVGNMLLTLNTELFLAMLATAGVRLLLEKDSCWYDATSAALLAVAALGVATKLPGAVLAAALVLPLPWLAGPLRPEEWRRQGRASILLCGCLLFMLAVLAFNSYATAWFLTGNPVFPLYNALFQSPLFDSTSNFSDPRWIHGFSIASYLELFFATSAYFEGLDFTAGFQYLLLLPLALPVLLRRVPLRSAVLLLLPLGGFGLLMFAQTQYWRYLFPVMPLASASIGALLLARTRPLQLAILAALGLCLALNVWFYPGVSWLLDLPAGRAYTQAGRDAITRERLPEKALTAHVNAIAPGSTVLYHDMSPFGATLLGKPAYLNWYAPERQAAFAGLRTPDELFRFLQAEGIDYVIWNMEDTSGPSFGKTLMEDYLRTYAGPLRQIGDFVLYEVGPSTAAQGPDPTFGADRQPASGVWRAVFSVTDLSVGAEPVLAIAGKTAGLARFRLNSRFACSSNGFIDMTILWDNGAPWERAVPCQTEPGSFIEEVTVPAAATRGELRLRARNTIATVSSLAMEID